MAAQAARLCPFCEAEGNLFGYRAGRRFLRCQKWRSVFEDVDLQTFNDRHEQVLEDMSFVEGIVEALGSEPDTRRWKEFECFLPGSHLLEIGSGSGHLLAAAKQHGKDVTAVEHSEGHRRFITTQWGIASVYASLEDPPPDEASFDSIVCVNVLEHMYEVIPALSRFHGLLAPGGRVLISTVNAEAIVLSAMRTKWSMFKPADHVSFPTRAGLAHAARAAGLANLRMWSSEQPFETPISFVVAARDSLLERRTYEQRSSDTPSSGEPGSGRRLARWVYSHARAVDPTSRSFARIGKAGTIKALLERQ
jgi:2-polyprenyl-3-methyl-5-hydroxy-6-metoxy-1,4-benzoquinol methylase